MRLAYAAKTGLPYTAIGGVLVERGGSPRNHVDAGDPRLDARQSQGRARAHVGEQVLRLFPRDCSARSRTGPARRANGAIDTPCAASPSIAAYGPSARRSGSIATSLPMRRRRPRLPPSDDRAGYRHRHSRRSARRCLSGAGAMRRPCRRPYEEPGRMIVLLPKPLAAQAPCRAMTRKPYQAPDHDCGLRSRARLKPLGKRARKDAEPAKAEADQATAPARPDRTAGQRTAIPTRAGPHRAAAAIGLRPPHRASD